MTVRRARMLWLERPAGATLSRHGSLCCPVPAAADVALKWVAMASAMVTKLPLNMLTPDTGLDYGCLKDARQACDSTPAARLVRLRTWNPPVRPAFSPPAGR